ncbi:MAG: hypothetical protein IPJ88_04115 [Myxococcales bacterium]|nr:MAG: hypothetical protein IPJ88_04115 [Myxococcales bacterium]
MLSVRTSASIGFWLLLLASCSSEGLDLHGKFCPCIEGYFCDKTTNLCVTNPSEPPADASQDVINDRSQNTDTGTTADASTDADADSGPISSCSEGYFFDPPDTISTWILNYAAGQALTNFEIRVTRQGQPTAIAPVNVMSGGAPDYIYSWQYEFAQSETLEFTLVADPGEQVYGGTCEVFIAP